MNATKIISSFCSAIFIALCASELFWQLTSITDEYFRYKVLTSTLILTPQTVDPLAMTLCVVIKSVFDYESANRDLKTKYRRDSYGHVKVGWDVGIKNMFKYTPPDNKILKWLIYKVDKRRHAPRANLSFAVEVTKFFIRNFVCYKIALKGDRPLTYRDIAVANDIEVKNPEVVKLHYEKEADISDKSYQNYPKVRRLTRVLKNKANGPHIARPHVISLNELTK